MIIMCLICGEYSDLEYFFESHKTVLSDSNKYKDCWVSIEIKENK